MDATPDWNIIRELYNKGLPLRGIAEQFNLKVGTVAARASRGNWKRIATQASVIAHKLTISIPASAEETPESNALAKASETVKGSLANALLQATGCLDTLPVSKSLKSRSASAQLLSTLAGVGKTVFGWSESSTQPLVRIDIMNNALSLSEQANVPRLGEKPVIDITPVPLPPPDC